MLHFDQASLTWPIKYSVVKSKLAIKIGERDPLTVFTSQRQKRLGIVDDMQLCKPYDHVIPEQFKAVIDSFVGKFLQYQANRERDTRELCTIHWNCDRT